MSKFTTLADCAKRLREIATHLYADGSDSRDCIIRVDDLRQIAEDLEILHWRMDDNVLGQIAKKMMEELPRVINEIANKPKHHGSVSTEGGEALQTTCRKCGGTGLVK